MALPPLSQTSDAWCAECSHIVPETQEGLRLTSSLRSVMLRPVFLLKSLSNHLFSSARYKPELGTVLPYSFLNTHFPLTSPYTASH